MASVRPAGEGEGQIGKLLDALDRQDYRGYLVIEPHLQLRLHELDATERFAVALAALRGLVGEAVARPH
jgi:sugar phosphate isomerase/epimerase